VTENSTENPQLVIVGAGMAGVTAGLQAQELGAQVVLIDKGETAGGSFAMSNGVLWCARTYDDLRRLIPMGDPELGRVLVEDFPDGVQWLENLGITFVPDLARPDRVIYSMQPGSAEVAARLLARFEAQGGMLMVNSAASELVLNENGAVSGVVAHGSDGLRTLPASAVILATGGFQGNPELMARYFGQWSDRFILRSNPNSTGDGFLMGATVGAASSRAMGSFYGHLLPAPPAEIPRTDFAIYTQYHSVETILVNLRGERFIDESSDDAINCQAVAREPEALAFTIYDDTVYKRSAVYEASLPIRKRDTFYESKALGASAAVAFTVEELAAEMQKWGVYGDGVLQTIREYNRAIAENRAAHLRIPRRAKPNPIVTPPFYALGLTPGVTFTLGGLRINANAQVLDRATRPIPGLYAAGGDTGGIYNEGYGGGLGLSLVFGRRAAKHAVAP
jgi:succinate dehydrogenase/fumarate reductase flavoprotein subunit